MPHYDFHCKACQQVFTTVKSIKEDLTAHPCPVCGAAASRHWAGTKLAVHGGPTTGARKVR